MPYRDELEAALARAEAAERKLAERCALHADRDATAPCSTCGRGLCEACQMIALDERIHCPGCFARAKRRQPYWSRPAIYALALVLAACAVAAILAVLARARVPPAAPRDLDAQAVADLMTRLEQQPCDEALAVKIADTLLFRYAKQPERTLVFLDAREKRCGPAAAISWRKASVLEGLARWQEAAVVSTTMLVRDPADAQIWRLHGRELAELGKLEQAAADMRQSLALHGSTPALERFGWLMKELGRPCEAVFAIRRGNHDQYATLDAIGQLTPATGCEAFSGSGEVTLSEEIPVVADGAAGRFGVDHSAAYVVVTRAFAARARLEVTGRPVTPVLVKGTLSPAWLTLADKLTVAGKAKAVRVEVAVVEELPGGLDGFLGNSLFDRFDVDGDLLRPPGP